MRACTHKPACLLSAAALLPALLLAGCGGSSGPTQKQACTKAKAVIAHAVAVETQNFPALSDKVKTAATLGAIAETEKAVASVAQAASGETAKKLSEYAATIKRQHRVIAAAAAHELSVLQAEDPGLDGAIREGRAEFAKACAGS